jgi:hypothetical protein
MDEQAKADMIEALELFNNKTEKLARSDFIKTMFGTDTGVTVSQNAGEPVKFILRGPTETEIDAFVLTFRFFYQPGERSSFGKVAAAYDGSDVEDTLKAEFIASVDVVNTFLDNPPDDFRIEFRGELLTRRRILEIFMYGDLAHSNKADKVKIFNEWSNVPGYFPFVQNEFNYILTKTFQVTEYLKELNETALKHLRS